MAPPSLPIRNGDKPLSSPDRNPSPCGDDVTPTQDVPTLNRDTLSAIKELDKMMAETIEIVFKSRLLYLFTLLFFAC